MTLAYKLLLVLAIAALGFASGFRVSSWRSDAARAAEIQQANADAQRRAEHVDQAAADYEQHQAAAEVRTRIIYREVQHVTAQPFYAPGAPLALDADGLRIVQAAVTGTDPASSPAPAVPGSDAAR